MRRIWVLGMLLALGVRENYGQEMPDAVLRIAEIRYAKVETIGNSESIFETSGKTAASNATGFRIGEKYVITNFHALVVDHDWMMNGKKAAIVRIDPRHDLALAKVAFEDEVPWIRLADARPGTYVYGMSNAGSEDHFVIHHFVSKLEAHYLYFQEPTIPGDSGTGLLDKEGSLVGLTMESASATNARGVEVLYSRAIPASVIKTFLKGILPE